MRESWAPIVGYEGLYEVSDQGNVKSLYYRRSGKSKTLKRFVNNEGYFTISIYKDKKKSTYMVHALMLMSFNPPKKPGLICRHINGNAFDCRLNNLEWGTYSENENDKRRHGRFHEGESQCQSSFTNRQANQIRLEHALGRVSQRGLAKKYGVAVTTISGIINYKTYKGSNH